MPCPYDTTTNSTVAANATTAAGSLVGQGFSADIKDRREGPASLPQAPLHSRPPERTTVSGPACSDSPAGRRDPSGPLRPRDDNANRIVTYREYVTRRTPPRELAREIIARSQLSSGNPREAAATEMPSGGRSFSSEINDGREAPNDLPGSPNRGPGSPSFLPKAPFSSGPCERTSDSFASSREKIDAIYLSPDAFARRTDEASIAEQMGDVFAAAGFPRPIPADDDRVGGWMLMYQMLDSGEWVLTDNCIELLRTLPNLVRDSARVEDVEKMDGDDPADAPRYGLKSRYGAHLSRGSSDRRMPLADRLAARVVSADPTIRAMQARKAQIEETRGAGPVKFPHRRRYRDNS